MKVWGIQYDKPQLYIPFPYFCTECSFQCNTTLIPSLGPTPRGCGALWPGMIGNFGISVSTKNTGPGFQSSGAWDWICGFTVGRWSTLMDCLSHLICKQTNSSIHLCDYMLQFGLCVHFKAMLKSSHCSVTDKYKCVSQPNQHSQYIYV